MDFFKKFKPKPYIKIKNKSFNDLNAKELAYMILADSSLSQNGNKYFDNMALDEFLTTDIVKNKDLLELKDFINKNIYIETNSNIKEINKLFLKKLASNLLKFKNIKKAIEETVKVLGMS